VEELIVAGEVKTAQEMLQHLAPPSALDEKLQRINLDAGRVFFLRCGRFFERAFAHLTASNIDPREVLAMFPALQVGAGADLGKGHTRDALPGC